MSLLTKLNQKLKDLAHKLASSKLVKTSLAFAMGLTIAVGACACGAGNTPNTQDPDHTVTDPSGKDPTTPGTTYSNLLMSVLHDEYYNNLISRVQADPSFYSSPLFDPHPYTFLQKQGHDVEKIKSGALSCTTETFIKDSEPNNLYMITYVENEGNFPYFTEYLLKAQLSDDEGKDYKMLHNQKYIQSIFINDQIAKSNGFEIVSKCNMSVEAHEGWKNTMRIQDFFTSYITSTPSRIDIILQNFSKEDRTFNILVFERIISSNPTYKSKIGYLELSRAYLMDIENNIFKGPYSDAQGPFSISTSSFENFKNTIDQATMFNSQTVTLSKTLEE